MYKVNKKEANICWAELKPAPKGQSQHICHLGVLQISPSPYDNLLEAYFFLHVTADFPKIKVPKMQRTPLLHGNNFLCSFILSSFAMMTGKWQGTGGRRIRVAIQNHHASTWSGWMHMQLYISRPFSIPDRTGEEKANFTTVGRHSSIYKIVQTYKSYRHSQIYEYLWEMNIHQYLNTL